MSLLTCLILLGCYVTVLANVYALGKFNHLADAERLDALSRRAPEEFLALGEVAATNIGETWTRLLERQHAFDPTEGRRMALFVAKLSADSENQVGPQAELLHSRGIELVDKAIHRVQAVSLASNAQPVTVAIRHIDRAVHRENWALGFRGVRENYRAVIKGSSRHSTAPLVAGFCAIALLAVSKIVAGDSVSVAGDFVALVAMAAFLAGLTLSPAIVLIRVLRESMASQIANSSGTRIGRRDSRRLRRAVWLVGLAGLTSFLLVYFRPLPLLMPRTSPSPEPGTLFFRGVMLVLVVAIWMFFLRGVVSEVRYAVRRTSTQRVGSIALVVQRYDDSGAPFDEPVPLPLSTRLRTLAYAAFTGPIAIWLMVSATYLAIAGESRIQPLREGSFAFLLLLSSAFLMTVLAPLIFLASTVAATLERRRRHRTYRALGIQVARRLNPLWAWLGFALTVSLFTWVLGVTTPEVEDSSVQNLEQFFWTYPVWSLATLFVAAAVAVGPFVLCIWTLFQWRRIRRLDAQMATRARIVISAQSLDVEGP